MKNLLLLTTIGLLSISCGRHKETVTIYNGTNGVDGKNAYNLITETIEVTATDCPLEAGGKRIDIYEDRDNNSVYSSGDELKGSLVSCNGVNGTKGEMGLVGPRGEQGQVGQSGIRSAGIVAIQLCQGDVKNHLEYAFVINNKIYATYFGLVDGVQSAFMTQLKAGNYVNTNGANTCQFSIENIEGSNDYYILSGSNTHKCLATNDLNADHACVTK